MREVAELLDLPEGTIRSWRVRGTGPPSYKFVGVVRYRLDEVQEWVASHRDHDGDTAPAAS